MDPDTGEPDRPAESRPAESRPAPSRPAQSRHVPVLAERVRELLGPALTAERAASGDGDGRPVVVDATLGLGGHADQLLRAYPGIRLVGLDADPAALRAASARLQTTVAELGLPADSVECAQCRYDALQDQLTALGLGSADAVLFDLGVSSMQLDERERGFAYSVDAPLDMRMNGESDPTTERTAASILNEYSQQQLARVLRAYGQERFAARIAAAVVRSRARQPLTRSAELVELIYDAVPAAARRTGGHPAKRTFQALRIEVNAELDVLQRALPQAINALADGGRMVVMSYHSLEDRIVKRALQQEARSQTPQDLPVELPGHGPRLRLLTRGAEQASDAEIQRNPRATSVLLRAAERRANQHAGEAA